MRPSCAAATFFLFLGGCTGDDSSGGSGTTGEVTTTTTGTTGTGSSTGGSTTGFEIPCPSEQWRLKIDISADALHRSYTDAALFMPVVGTSQTAVVCFDPPEQDDNPDPMAYSGFAEAGSVLFDGPDVAALPQEMVDGFAMLRGVNIVFDYDSGADTSAFTFVVGSAEPFPVFEITVACDVSPGIGPDGMGEVVPALAMCDSGTVELKRLQDGNQTTDWLQGAGTFSFEPD